MQWDDRARRLLDMARSGHDPSGADAERVRRAFRARWLLAPALLSAKAAAVTGLGLTASTVKTVAAIAVIGSVGTAALYGGGVRIFGAHPAEPRQAAPADGAAHPGAQGLDERAQIDAGSTSSAIDVKTAAPRPIPSATAARRDRPSLRFGATAPPSARSRSTGALSADLSPELAGLRRAQEALHRGEPSAALAALAQLDQQIPTGTLVEERQATGAIARCALGKDRAAQREAFLRRFPNSVHAARVNAACSSTKP
ncbi:MAG: hypothetical protein JW940_32035 [Polyangiaceae bacterium]|nr:hypothetical protein [Polyangiaceae bacterium]